MALVVAGGSGCSWLFVNKPPPGPVEPAPPASCTGSVASPVVDTVLGALLVGGGIAVIALSVPKPAPPCTGWCFNFDFDQLNAVGYAAGGVLIAGAIPLAFSAAHGYSTTADCRELHEAQLSCVSGVEASCTELRERKPP
jgi:hypothetical protein